MLTREVQKCMWLQSAFPVFLYRLTHLYIRGEGEPGPWGKSLNHSHWSQDVPSPKKIRRQKCRNTDEMTTAYYRQSDELKV